MNLFDKNITNIYQIFLMSSKLLYQAVKIHNIHFIKCRENKYIFFIQFENLLV